MLPQSWQSSVEDTHKIEISSKWRKEIEKEMERYAWLDKQCNAWLKWLNCNWRLVCVFVCVWLGVCVHDCTSTYASVFCVWVFLFCVSQGRGDERILGCHKTLGSCTYLALISLCVPAKLTCPWESPNATHMLNPLNIFSGKLGPLLAWHPYWQRWQTWLVIIRQ